MQITTIYPKLKLSLTYKPYLSHLITLSISYFLHIQNHDCYLQSATKTNNKAHMSLISSLIMNMKEWSATKLGIV